VTFPGAYQMGGVDFFTDVTQHQQLLVFLIFKHHLHITIYHAEFSEIAKFHLLKKSLKNTETMGPQSSHFFFLFFLQLGVFSL